MPKSVFSILKLLIDFDHFDTFDDFDSFDDVDSFDGFDSFGGSDSFDSFQKLKIIKTPAQNTNVLNAKVSIDILFHF